jgi:hypothetical protein
MFATKVLTAFSLVACALAAPSSLNRRTNPFTLDTWGGFHSLDHFDDFYGADNFVGISKEVTVVKKEQEVVCHSVDVVVIQQQLAIIREYVKKLITTQICEVETQTVVFSQFQSHISSFHDDIRRRSHRQVVYDDDIASRIGSIHDEHGEIVSHDFGFHGSDIGSHSISVSGCNWNDATSPDSVEKAFGAAQGASFSSGGPSLGSF